MSRPIQLHVDLDVDPAREAELAAGFRDIFRPAISAQPGFLAVELMKLSEAVVGEAPGYSHRLLISFQTEAQRRQWVATGEHQRAWPAIAGALRPDGLRAVVYQLI